MSKEKRRVPKLRFPGFTEDWEQRKLGSIGSTYTGLSGKTKEDFGHGEAQYITYLNVFQNTVSDITMTDKVEIDTTQNEVKYGDVLFTTSSETPEEVGMSSVWLGHMPNIYLNSFCFGFRPNQKIDPYFLGYSLRAPYMRDKIKILAQGISRYNISKNKVMELEISLPNNEEQRLLGNFLRNIDLSITLHQRKLDNLKLKKKALLQKLFPKNGERYPELRFPGFTDAWEQRKLDDIAKIKTGGGTPKTANPEYWSGNIPWIQSSDLVEGDIVHVNINKFINNNALKNSAAKLISRNSIALVTRVGVGKVAVINQDFTTSQDFLSLSEFDGSDIKFLAYQLYRLMQENAKVLQGTSIKGITKTELSEQNISIPSSGQEQNLISDILSKIDSIITLHQRKLEHLKLQKKALLQQMFV